MTDETSLLERAKAYDKAALSELYDRYAPKMYAYIYRRVSDAPLAEDLTGELFVRMLRAIQNEQVWRHSLRAWLYRIAHNLVVDHYRRQQPTPGDIENEALQVQVDGVPNPGNPAHQVERIAEQERLQAAIEQLTPEQQHVLALRFGEGLRARQVAEIMNKTVGSVEALQRRGLATLKRILGGER